MHLRMSRRKSSIALKGFNRTDRRTSSAGWA
jgi:hypothetical protein